MYELKISGQTVSEIQEKITELAEQLCSNQETNAEPTTAITPLMPAAQELHNADVQQTQASVTKQKRTRKGAGASGDNVSGALENVIPTGVTAPVKKSEGALAPFTAVGAPVTSNFENLQAEMKNALLKFLDSPYGGEDKALLIMQKYKAEKMSDVKSQDIPAFIAELEMAGKPSNGAGSIANPVNVLFS